MKLRTSIQLSLGALLFLAGSLLATAAVAGFFLPGLAALLPAGTALSYASGALLLAGGAALVVTSHTRPSEAIGISILFLTLALLLPGIGPFAILGLSVVLCQHAWKKGTNKVALEEVNTPLGDSYACPINAPLAGIRNTLSNENLQNALLGMSQMAPGKTRPLLKSLRKNKDVRVLLYANGLLNDHLNLFEKRFAALQDEAIESPADAITLTALVETYADLMQNKLIPADELAGTTERAIAAANQALELDPGNGPVLAAKTRFELLQADFAAAYGTIQQLYALPDCFDQARALHAELLFEHAATRPVRCTRGTPVTPPVPRHVMN